MRSLHVSPLVQGVSAPPIAEAASWVAGRKSNRDLLNLSQAVPSYPPAAEMQAEIARLASLPETGFYTDIRGIAPLREQLAAHMATDYAGDVRPDDVTITSGCNQAFCAALMALAERGDNVILPVPYYFNHQMWLDMLGIEHRHIPAFSDGRAYPAPADAASLINDRTRAIVLCSPNNPTGATYPPHVLREFFELASSHGLALVIDETYKDFRSDPAPLHDLLADAKWRDCLIQLYSFSKVFAMTGYRAGSIIAGQKVQDQADKVLDCMAICAPAISQHAALFGLQHLSAWKNEKNKLMAERRAALLEAFRRPDLRYELVSSGAYFAYVRHPFADQPSKSVAQRLAQQHDVLCLPGTMFGPGQEQYLRLAFANSPAEDMPRLVERLIESQTMSGVEGLSHITLVANNLDRMEAILVGVLAARCVYDSGTDYHSHSPERFYIVGQNHPVWVAVMQGDGGLPRSYNHLAFKISEDGYDACLAAIVSLGLEVRPPRPRKDGEARSIYFHDEDNHLFELHTGTLEERLRAYGAANTS